MKSVPEIKPSSKHCGGYVVVFPSGRRVLYSNIASARHEVRKWLVKMGSLDKAMAHVSAA